MIEEKINNGYFKISVERLTNEDRRELENLGFSVVYEDEEYEGSAILESEDLYDFASELFRFYANKRKAESNI